MKNNLKISFLLMLLMTLLLGGIYPLITYSIGKLLFAHASKGSLLFNLQTKAPIGSKWIAQPFVQDKYFHPRPSFGNYQTAFPYSSNLNPYEKKYIYHVKENLAKYIRTNALNTNTKIPLDAICYSASGIDPHISLENALLQAPRVANARRLTLTTIKKLINKHTIKPTWGFLGSYHINVLLINLELDEIETKNPKYFANH